MKGHSKCAIFKPLMRWVRLGKVSPAALTHFRCPAEPYVWFGGCSLGGPKCGDLLADHCRRGGPIWGWKHRSRPLRRMLCMGIEMAKLVLMYFLAGKHWMMAAREKLGILTCCSRSKGRWHCFFPLMPLCLAAACVCADPLFVFTLSRLRGS